MNVRAKTLCLWCNLARFCPVHSRRKLFFQLFFYNAFAMAPLKSTLDFRVEFAVAVLSSMLMIQNSTFDLIKKCNFFVLLRFFLYGKSAGE